MHNIVINHFHEFLGLLLGHVLCVHGLKFSLNLSIAFTTDENFRRFNAVEAVRLLSYNQFFFASDFVSLHRHGCGANTLNSTFLSLDIQL